MKRIAILSTTTLLLLAGCATDEPRVSEYLDPQTAVTIRTLDPPLIYARDAPELAANARDYLSLGVVEVNRMGDRKHYVALISWSTIDRHDAGTAPVAERIEIAAGGRTREFAVASHEARSLGIGDALFRPPSGYAGESWYAVTPADLRSLAAATPDSITLVGGPHRITYLAWRVSGDGLAAFVRDIPDAVTSQRR